LAQGAVVYPATPFRALQLTPLRDVKVVILGQDPYHGAGQAHGLAFSVPVGVRIPPSLRNIQKEILRDGAAHGPAGQAPECDGLLQASPGEIGEIGEMGVGGAEGVLDHWARQGVLLLNTCLTVEDGAPASHAKQGWEALTDGIIQAVWAKSSSVVFMLWGAHAQAKAGLLTQPQPHHQVLLANHPSPLSALRPPKPFIGCGHFGFANVHLREKGLSPIDW
jgi:uracil-DNA glycosylase